MALKPYLVYDFSCPRCSLPHPCSYLTQLGWGGGWWGVWFVCESGGLCHSRQGTFYHLQGKKAKVITLPITDLIKVFLHFFIIKRSYFSAVRYNKFSKRSQQWFHHCTLKQTFQKSFPWFFVSCKTNARGQLLLSLATLACRCSWPAFTHKA